jgi:hypothetical protein
MNGRQVVLSVENSSHSGQNIFVGGRDKVRPVLECHLDRALESVL